MAAYQNDKSSVDDKVDIVHEERGPHYEGVDENGEPIDKATAVILPESIAELSEEELVTLRTSITRKIDMLASWPVSLASPVDSFRSCLRS